MLRKLLQALPTSSETLGYRTATVQATATTIPLLLIEHLGVGKGDKLYFFPQKDGSLVIYPEWLVKERFEDDLNYVPYYDRSFAQMLLTSDDTP